MAEGQNYLVPEGTWDMISAELQGLSTRIQSGEELSETDFALLKAKVREIENYGKEYTRALNAQSKQYKQWLDWKLNEIGYREVKQYMAVQKQKHDQEVNQRMSRKLHQFKEIVHEELDLHPLIKSTGLRETILNSFIGRFPKVNSGAVDKEISNWTPIRSVIHVNLEQIENILTENQAMLYLPIYSNTFRAFSDYLRTGNVTHLENISVTFQSDAELLRKVVMKKEMKSLDDVMNLITAVTTSDADNMTKLSQIKQLILVWESV